ncbi:DUF4229 domain-containing protein [Corynebacterium choanae]|uniref:DUF4229 domain-containing protein n=1 Tax=Corynebacterium choanae TaxID=1862358 RepID=A0A3G6JCS4_9CORY|nr:DUF4229 domain-containing protein [Corynebacterium choanae]AZA14460.1 hypothetical protein CCHOA_10405 [Corynebacterium choanae]
MENNEVVAPVADPGRRPWRDLALYTVARIGLFLGLWLIIAVLAGLFGTPVPLLMSALLALIVTFPLSFFVFQSLRARVTQELATWGEQRKAHRAWVQQQIAGREE